MQCRNVIMFFILCCCNVVFTQNTFSKILDLEDGMPDSGVHFQILYDQLIVVTSHLCPIDGSYEDCSGIAKFDFSGELIDFHLFKNFDSNVGSISTIEGDTIYMLANDVNNNLNSLSALKVNLDTYEKEIRSIGEDISRRHISEGMLNFNNRFYSFGHYSDAQKQGIRGFVSKWSKGFQDEIAFWSFFENQTVTIGDLKPTIDSNLAFIVYEAHAGVNYSLPVHIVKMDTLGNLIAEKELERSPNGRTNLAEDSFGNFYTDIERAFESDIVKIDKELNEILWLTTLPADYLGIDQRYKVLDVEVANNGDVLVSGEASYLHQESGVVCGSFLGRLSSEGELLWFKLLSNVSDENDIDDDSFRKSYLLEIKELPNGNIAGTGATIKFLEAGGVNQELWLLSIDENGCIEGFDCKDDIYVLNTGDSFPTITSTKELAEIDDSIFYPNPVSDILNLTMEGNFEYQISNLQSQIKVFGKNDKEVDINHLPAGIYFLQIKQDNQLFEALKFIKI